MNGVVFGVALLSCLLLWTPQAALAEGRGSGDMDRTHDMDRDRDRIDEPGEEPDEEPDEEQVREWDRDRARDRETEAEEIADGLREELELGRDEALRLKEHVRMHLDIGGDVYDVRDTIRSAAAQGCRKACLIMSVRMTNRAVVLGYPHGQAHDMVDRAVSHAVESGPLENAEERIRAQMERQFRQNPPE